MAQRVHAARLPPQARSVVLSDDGSDWTLYTVPDGHTFTILTAWISLLAAGSSVSATLIAPSEDGPAASIIGVVATDGTVESNAVECEVRCAPGTTITFAADGPYIVRYGVSGYLD